MKIASTSKHIESQKIYIWDIKCVPIAPKRMEFEDHKLFFESDVASSNIWT